MAATNFQEAFRDRYQDILGKSMVAMKIANTSLRSDLSFGDKVHRFKLDLSNVLVRDVVRGTDQTIDALADSDQTLDIDQQKGAAFQLPDWDKLQSGPLELGMVAGREVALKVRRYIDADVLYQVVNATYQFDTGNLTTVSNTNVPITMSTTNVPILITRTAAQLQQGNVPEGDWAIVLDPIAISWVAQHAIGKDLDLSENVLRNGYLGNLLFGMKLYSSNNLTGEARMTMDAQPSDGDTLTIQGVVFTFKTALTPTAGEVLIGGSADVARANLVLAINGGAGAGINYVALSTANRTTITYTSRITATNDNSTNLLTLIGKGSGRLTLAEGLTDAGDIWDINMIHAFAGKVGAIDAVVQADPTPSVRQEPKQLTSNVLVDALYGIKVFDDGADKMTDIWIASAA